MGDRSAAPHARGGPPEGEALGCPQRRHDARARQILEEKQREAWEAGEDEESWKKFLQSRRSAAEQPADEAAEKPAGETIEEAAEKKAKDLAARAVSLDPDEWARAQRELAAMGLSPLDFMSDADCNKDGSARRHDEKIKELERRRRELKRDYDALQKLRPVEIEAAVEAEAEDAEVVWK